MGVFLRNRWVFYGIVFVLLFILIVLTIIAFTPANNLSTKNIAPTPKAVDLCAPFSKETEGISCEKAKEIVARMYPGVTKRIRKDITMIPMGKDTKPKLEKREIWLIAIHLDKPFETPVLADGKKRTYTDLEIGIDKITGKFITSRNI